MTRSTISAGWRWRCPKCGQPYGPNPRPLVEPPMCTGRNHPPARMECAGRDESPLVIG